VGKRGDEGWRGGGKEVMGGDVVKRGGRIGGKEGGVERRWKRWEGRGGEREGERGRW
jgi:hypothetical protein